MEKGLEDSKAISICGLCGCEYEKKEIPKDKKEKGPPQKNGCCPVCSELSGANSINIEDVSIMRRNLSSL